MKIFIAGASGAIGLPLVTLLIKQGHDVTGMTRSDTGVEAMQNLGAQAARVSAFDQGGLIEVCEKFKPEVVIDQLTSLPKSPLDMATARDADRKLRLEGGSHLLRAAVACGARRYLQQSSGFFLEPGQGLADESVGFALGASPGVADHARSYTELESRLFQTASIEGVALRYGFFYGPQTWYNSDGACADMARRSQMAIVGEGDAAWSWVHIDDAALATTAALTSPPGIYHVVDDHPSPVSQWLPAFAAYAGAPAPPRISIDEARATRGEDAIYYGTKLRGASNAKAKSLLSFQPRPLEWLA